MIYLMMNMFRVGGQDDRTLKPPSIGGSGHGLLRLQPDVPVAVRQVAALQEGSTHFLYEVA